MTRLLMTTDAVGGVWQYAHELARALQPHGLDTILAVMGPTPSRHPGLEPGSRCLPAEEEAGPRIKSGVTRENDPNSLSHREREGAPKARKGEGDTSAPIEVIETNLPLDWLATDPTQVTQAGDAIAALAAEVGADLVHLNSPALAAHARFPVPVVAVAHGCIASWWEAAHGTPPAPDYAWHADLMARGLAVADVVVAPSAAFAATIQRLYALPTVPLVVHNGRAAQAAIDAAQAVGAFTAGRLWDPVKNTALLDQVAALLNTPFRAAGPLTGPHGETASIAHLDHLGTLSDAEIATTLATRPVFVSATRFEPFGLSVLEAAAAGCPLVLSDIATFRELWTGAALLVPEETPQAYAAAIARIEGDPDLRRHLGEAARVRAARYTPAAMGAGMAAIYAGLLASSLQSAAA